VQIVEVILPMDYYTNLLGVLIDYKVFQKIMYEKLPKLCKHLDEYNFDLNLLITKWLICLFINHLPQDTELAVWDLFLIKGVSVLFRVAITLFQLM
jgi:small G protein signaling modulator 3